MCALWVDITCQKRTASWEGGVGQVGMSTVIRPYHNIFCQAWLWQLLAVFKLTPPPSTPQRIPGGGGGTSFQFSWVFKLLAEQQQQSTHWSYVTTYVCMYLCRMYLLKPGFVAFCSLKAAATSRVGPWVWNSSKRIPHPPTLRRPLALPIAYVHM